MPEQPTPEQDPIVTRSFAGYYAIATVLLIGSLFWALWDEAYGQRPWKSFQHEFTARYEKFLNSAKSKSDSSLKDIEFNSEYQQLDQAAKAAESQAAPKLKELNDKIRDASARLLAVQGVFTDKRAYVNALTYEMETEESQSGKDKLRKEIEEYKKGPFKVEYPDGSKKQYTFEQLEGAYNDIKAEKAAYNA